DTAVVGPVVPRLDRAVGALRPRRPSGDRLAEEMGDVALRHALLEREQFLARDSESIERGRQTAKRLLVARIVGKHRAIEANGILMTAQRRQLAREIELHAAIDIARSRMFGIARHKSGERSGVQLLLE